MSDPDPDDGDPHRRMTTNLLAIIVVLLLLGAGFWLVWQLTETKRAQDCLAAGFRNCAPSQRIWP